VSILPLVCVLASIDRTCYHCDIFCEAKPLPLFPAWEPPEYVEFDENVAISESPLFCLGPDFSTASDDSRCSSPTRALLRAMLDLTNLIIERNCVYDVNETKTIPLYLSDVDYASKIAKTSRRLTLLPSACTPGLLTSRDWVYEACRITALIYTASIVLRLPFSVTADPNRNPLVSESEASSNPDNGAHLLFTRLSEALYEILERTDLANLWSDMSRVLYWVCAVGAAAARAPAATNILPQPHFRSVAYTIWVRRCLTMYSMRVMTVLVFQHLVPVLQAQKRLLKVQELIGTYN
jgi:hypothetical protein